MSVQNSFLLKYTKTSTKDKQQCPHCNKVFSLPAILSKHLKTHHDITDSPSPKKATSSVDGAKKGGRLRNEEKSQSKVTISPNKTVKNEKSDASKTDKKVIDEPTNQTPRRRGRPRKNVSTENAQNSVKKDMEKQTSTPKLTSTSSKKSNSNTEPKSSTPVSNIKQKKGEATPGSKRIHQSDTDSDCPTDGRGRPKRNRREKRAWSPSNDNSIVLETSIKQEPIDDEYGTESDSKMDISSPKVSSHSCDICSRSFSTYAGLHRHSKIHTDLDVERGEIGKSPQKKKLFEGNNKLLQKQTKLHIKVEKDKDSTPQEQVITGNETEKNKTLQNSDKNPEVDSTENSGEVHVVIGNATGETEETIQDLVAKVISLEEKNRNDTSIDVSGDSLEQVDDRDEDYRPSKDDVLDIKKKIKLRKRGRRCMGRTYPCKSCEKIFTKPSHLLRHNTKHTGERPFPCDVCGKGFVSKSNMEKHRVLHSGVKSKICDECGKAFALSSYLVRHKMLHEKERNEKLGIKPPPEHHLCFECGKVFSKALYLQKHMERHVKGKCYECRICGKKFSQRMNRINHEFLHNKTKDLECNICHKKFALKCYLKIHMQRHEKSAEGKMERKQRPNLGQKPYECSQCGKCYSSAKYLSSHQKRHENPKKFVCETCGRNFQQKINLQRHMLTHTDPATSKNYECKECGKKYSRDIYLDRHVKENHTPEGLAKPRHHCQYCEKVFMKPCLLRIHERTHTKEKPFVCSTCGKGFAQEGYMRIHEEIHSTYKKHECQFCGKSFALLYYLTRHLARHEQVKSLPCDQCTKMFASQKALDDHKRIHSGDLPFQCDVCQRSFPRLNSLQRHKKMNACQKIGPHKPTITVGTFRYIAAGSSEAAPVTYTEETLDNFMDRKEFSCLYICSICRQVFTSQAKLDAHAVEHAGEEVTMETVHTVVQEEPIAAEAIPVTKEEETIIAEVVDVDENLLQVGGEEVTTLTTEETIVDSDWLNKLFSNAHVESGTDGKIIIVVNRE